ncbi:uncharacterized protein BXZ73DRAFT_108335 [Epithele typhae]|uniref:uncharacterized protein n=1 Tax=Epithele typhae TaxID=378194 RepID=UPI0020079FC9|nr:uncharacterized protein BXZ73DRAFT_108335 [Epithele typhae]KAH9910972.1 hypothetical protein BXZ73DRAFT_108335 [Epithele typhae]
MPVPPTLTSYLPVLLVSVTRNAVPDDSSFDTQPEGQVDYLSHDWKEEDVWRSWRSMTRQKNAIANGMRLENASWRTWWKQRNNLKTISPETLNWLKDSDVTWLYGPLHIGNDWTDYSQRKLPKGLAAIQRKTSTDALPGPYKINTTPTAQPTKPILKRRSISQLLSLPASSFFAQCDSDEEDCDYLQIEPCSGTPSSRPSLVHTRSDSHIAVRGRPYRKVSPPRIIAEEVEPVVSLSAPSQAPASSDASGSAGSDQDLSGQSSTEGPVKKKHISFNTFVEQCIAIEKPKPMRSSTGSSRGSRVFDAYDDGYDSELGYDGEFDEPALYYFNDNAVIGSDSEDEDDDDGLIMQTASSRSRTNSISSIRKASMASTLTLDPSAPSRPRPPLVRRASTDREHFTIAPIAPTLLKSTGVGNELMPLREGKALDSPNDVDLVYVPNAGHFGVSGTPSHEDVYHHRESYFSVGTTRSYPRSPLPRSPAPGSSPHMPSVGMPPEQSQGVPIARNTSETFFASHQVNESPMDIDDSPVEGAYDYFGGPDLGEDFSYPHGQRRVRRGDVRNDDSEVVRYSEDGAASAGIERNDSWRPSPADSPSGGNVDMPVVVVNEVNGAVEERQERSRESSPSRSPQLRRLPEPQPDLASSPSLTTSAAIPVPMHRPSPYTHIASSASATVTHQSMPPSSICADSSLLSPPDMDSARGRTIHVSPSVSGSTTTGSSSYHSSDSRSGSSSRGRSSTRNSSFSDRERSGSQGESRSRSRSRGTSSPLGSISPTGSAIGIVATSGAVIVGGRTRGRDADRSGRRKGSEEERGRERAGRRLENGASASMSPPSLVSSPARGNSDESPVFQSYSPSLVARSGSGKSVPSPPSSVSGSSTETASVSTIGPGDVQAGMTTPTAASWTSATPQTEDADNSKMSVELATPKKPTLPSPIEEEEEEEETLRSRQPTPANSPVAAFRIAVPPAQKAAPVSSPVSASHEPSPSTSRTSTSTSFKSTDDSDPASPVSPDSPKRSSGGRHPSRSQRVSFDGMQEQAGTLVNRAAEIVQSARGFLGSIWSSHPGQNQPAA